VQAGVLDSDAAARCGLRVASMLRALLALAGVSIVATFAAQIALHVAAHRAALEHDPCPDEHASRGSLAMLRAIVRETALSLVVVLLWPFGVRGAAGGGRAVVLVHDVACSPASLWLMARRLRHAGWAVIVPRLGLWWSDLEVTADRLGMSLARARDGADDGLMVVAHGLGGLAARALLQREGRHAGVRLLVTLGTAHAGTRALPWLPVGPYRSDVRPGSELLRAIGGAALPPRTDAVAIAPTDDALVVPAANGLWAEACNISVAGSGHLDLLVSGRVFGVIAENLAAVPDGALRGHGR
jgi:hypothetical protein